MPDLNETTRQFTEGMITKALSASFGESNNDLSVSFKKTVLIRDYETEVIEANTTLHLDKPITGAERIFITSILRVQLEYEAYVNLLMKGLVTETMFNNRKNQLANELFKIKEKAEVTIDKSLDEYLECELK